MMEKLLLSLYNKSLLSKSKFIKLAKKTYPELTNEYISTFVDKQKVQQITKTNIKRAKYYKIISKPRSFQIDLFFLEQYKKYNKYSIFLLFTDILSRKAFIEPIKNKESSSILNGIKKIKEKIGHIHSISSDDEFNKSIYKNYFEENNIKFKSIVAKEEHFSKGNKLGIVDSATRSIKRIIKRYMLTNNTPKFVKELPDLLSIYNNTEHTSIKTTPNKLYDNEEQQNKIYDEYRKYNDEVQKKIDLDIGDYVRLSLSKSKFEKEKQKYSSEIYNIFETDGYRYILMDMNGKIIKGSYNHNQLLKIPDTTIGCVELNELLDRYYGVSNKTYKEPKNKIIETEKEYKKIQKIKRTLNKEGIDANNIIIRRFKRLAT